MNRRVVISVLLYLNLALLIALIGYKAYLLVFPTDVEALHSDQIARLETRVADDERLRLAVVGNVNNSIGVFENQIIPRINDSEVDLVVSAGNAVSGGGEDKYRALVGTLSHLERPYLLTFGENEYEEFGSYRFYERFGPHFYSARAADTHLVFLDSTGKTPVRWQERWLDDLLAGTGAAHVLVFMGHPLIAPEEEMLFASDDGAWSAPQDRARLMEMFARHGVDAVFSAGPATFADQALDGVRYVTTGGGGGFVLNTETSFYHYLTVTSGAGEVEIGLERLDSGQSPLMSRLESLWFFIYSLFYVSAVNFLLIFSALLLVTVKLYRLLYRERDYYPHYDVDPTPWRGRPLRVAMFTNNYLPYVGGVPISIARLRGALEAQGHTVMIVAPGYPDAEGADDPQVLRVRPLVPWGLSGEFTIANIFQRGIRRRLREFRPDVIHLHHPFWMGSLGLFLARRKKVPAIYTYHTRLEHYAHYIPFPGRLFRNVISHWLVERFANKCSAAIVPTAAAKEYMRLIGVWRPIFVQPTGIDYETFLTVPESRVAALRKELEIGDEPVLVTASRLSPEKNVAFLIRAVARLKERLDRPFRLLILGEGADRPRLEALIATCGLEDRVTFAGAVAPEEMAAHYRLGDVFVFASKSETQGMVVVEAMAAGLPVVAVDSSGIDDFVRHGHNGFKTLEDIDAWSGAVESLLRDAARRAEMGRWAQAFARQYALDAFADSIGEVYARAIAEERRQPDDSRRSA